MGNRACRVGSSAQRFSKYAWAVRAHPTVRCMAVRAYSWLTGYSGHSSSAIRMSLPNASCVSTVDSGVNLWVSPFRWDWKTTPSAVILRSPLRLKTWNPHI